MHLVRLMCSCFDGDKDVRSCKQSRLVHGSAYIIPVLHAEAIQLQPNTFGFTSSANPALVQNRHNITLFSFISDLTSSSLTALLTTHFHNIL